MVEVYIWFQKFLKTDKSSHSNITGLEKDLTYSVKAPSAQTDHFYYKHVNNHNILKKTYN